MGFILDSLIQEIIDQDTTVNSAYASDPVDISGTEDDFSIQFTYDNGSTVDMVLSLEGSINGTDWSQITDSTQTITDNSGSHIWDVSGSGLIYLRVAILVNGGSIDIDKILFSGKRRH